MARRRRRIAVVTGSRADFGLLTPVMHAIAGHPMTALFTVAAGTHWTAKTSRDILEAGFAVDAEVRMQQRNRIGRWADVDALGRGVQRFGSVFAEAQPEVVVVLGDRIEALAAATAASVGGLHAAHIHGGDRAEGVADEAMRHAVSKLSHIHLAATAESRRRLIRMGEQPDLVFDVGSPAVDGLASVRPSEHPPRWVVAQHPIGADDDDEARWMKATLEAVLAETRQAERGSAAADQGESKAAPWVLVSPPNGDPGSVGVARAIEKICAAEAANDGRPSSRSGRSGSAASTGGRRRSPVRLVVKHVPRPQFAAHVAGSRGMVGNSSAGLIEAAVLGVPAVNIGPREDGREKPGNVIDCAYGRNHVRAALASAVELDRSRITHPYGPGGTGEAIAELLATIDLDDVPLRKRNTY